MKRKSLFVALVPLIIILALLLVHRISASPAPQPNKPITVSEPIATPETLLVAVNAERAKYGAAPLVEDPRLDQSAQAKACDERDNNYFGHVDKSGKHGYQLAEEALGMPGKYGENITQPTPVTTTQSMYNWNNSKLHHDAMVSTSATLTGFGVCGGDVVEHFYIPS